MLARAASCDVTPRDRQVRLAGYALRTAPVSTILDAIEISAVLLECPSQRCLIFSFDLMIVGSELEAAILARLQRLGFRHNEVVLLASHTHNAPATDQACRRLGIADQEFVNDVAAAAEDLVHQIQGKQPSEINLDIFQGQLHHSINRRRYWPFPTVGRMHGFQLTSVAFSPNPSGPKNETATVALFRDRDGEPLAALWHYTCHPTAVMPVDVISADYPGAVRQALRERFGRIPCIFAQGFCGNIRPDIKRSAQKFDWRESVQKTIRIVAFGNMFPTLLAGDWLRWSRSLAAGVLDLAQGAPVTTVSPTTLQTGSASIPLTSFFSGAVPDKVLSVQIVRLGEEIEIVALSAEPCVEWQRILDEAVPVREGRIRLYAGYLGALFGYLPTAAQVVEGGYEVEGFQPFFGLSGKFDSAAIGAAVTACVKSAFENCNARDRLHESVTVKTTRLANGLEIAEINPHETSFLYEEIFVQEVYASYDLHIPAEGIVLDIGANIGMFSLYMARKFPGVRVLCFEPAPHCLERLRINLAPLGEAARIFATALGDTTGEVEFSYYPQYSIMSGMFADEREDVRLLKAGARTQYKRRFGSAPDARILDLMVSSRLGNRQIFQTPITTISRIIAAENIDQIALVKIDVERAENLVLAGIDDADWTRIDQLVVEVHDQGAREHDLVADMLKRRGYRTHIFAEPMLVNSDIYVVVGKR